MFGGTREEAHHTANPYLKGNRMKWREVRVGRGSESGKRGRKELNDRNRKKVEPKGFLMKLNSKIQFSI